MFRKTKLATAVVATSAAMAAPVLYAQGQIEEIIVTATKQAESMQDVPVAVSALTGEALEAVSSFDDYAMQLPSVVFQGTGPGQNEIYIRGAATSQTIQALSTAAGLQPSVALYQDEMPVALGGRNLDIYSTDMERIEVLPGPQGTLFGASSQAGTVRLITNKPDHSGLYGGFKTGLSSTNGGEMGYTTEAYINLPLTEKVATRLAVYSARQGGWIDNVLNDPANGGFIGSPIVIDRVSGGVLLADPANTPVDSPSNGNFAEDDFNDAHYSGARLGVDYLINDNWSLLLQHTSQSLDTEGVWTYDPTVGENKTVRFAPDKNDDTFGLTTWTLEGRLAQLDLVYTGGYLDRETDMFTDYTYYSNGGQFAAYYSCIYGTPDPEQCLDPTGYFAENITSERTTHEFRFSTDQDRSWRVTAGVFLDEQITGTVGQFALMAYDKLDIVYGPAGTNLTLPDAEGRNSAGPFGERITWVNDFTRTTEQTAFFANLDFDLTDDLTASVGARVYQIDDTYEGATPGDDVTERIQAFVDGDQALIDYFGAADAQPFIDAVADGTLDTSDFNSDGALSVDDTIFRASLDWRLNQDVMLFTTYSEGFRPPVTNRVGGDLAYEGNTPGSNFEDYRIPLGSVTDELTNYELGIKSDLLDGTLRLNATAYWSEIENLQTSRFDPANISFLWFLDNVGDAKINGIDGDFTWVPTDQLTISGGFSLLNSELTSLNPELEGIAPPVGSSLPSAADLSASITARYDFFLEAADLESYLSANLVYSGDRLAGMNMNANVEEDATILLFGQGSGLEIEQESPTYAGAGYTDRNGDAFGGGRYVMPSYSMLNVAWGVSKDNWRAELYIDNLTDEAVIHSIDTQTYTPRVVQGRPRTLGLTISMDFE